jgi:small nuclear ribonucleoprotein D3
MIVTMTSREGRVTKLEQVFLRGGQIKFIVLPELLKDAPIFKKVQLLKAKKIESTGKTTAKGARASAKIKK